jgi:hypothetical protein
VLFFSDSSMSHLIALLQNLKETLMRKEGQLCMMEPILWLVESKAFLFDRDCYKTSYSTRKSHGNVIHQHE